MTTFTAWQQPASDAMGRPSGVRESRTKPCFVAATVVALSYLHCVASLNVTDRTHGAQRQCANTECRSIVMLGVVTM